MSKPRQRWWGYAKNAIRVYPRLKEEHDELQSQALTANYSPMPRSGGVSRTTELVATRELSPQDQRDYEAVRSAIEETELHRGGKDRMRVVRLVFWRGYDIRTAAMRIPVSEETAKDWHGAFIYLVGVHMGLIERDDVPQRYRWG